jgi:hypothetical protein
MFLFVAHALRQSREFSVQHGAMIPDQIYVIVDVQIAM